MILKYIGKFFDTLMDRIVSVTGAIVFSQVPQLIMQYLRVLEGAMAEAKKNLDVAKSKAAELGLSLNEFIKIHLDNANPVFKKSGEVYQQAVLRYEGYQESYTALNSANVFTRPFVFISNLDTSLISAMDFTPGLPLTSEGAIYAICGILVALGIYHGILKQPFKLFGKKEKPQTNKAPAKPAK